MPIVIVTPPPVIRIAPRLPVAGAIFVRTPAPRLPVAGMAMATAVAGGVAARRTVSAGTRPDAYWDHNNSVMRLVLEEESIQFSYEVPRSGLSSLGISRGTKLIEGRNVGGVKYAGTAYTFSRQCGPAGYEVEGEATPDGAKILLRGLRPIRNDRCEVVRKDEEALALDIVPNRAGIRTEVPAPLLPVEVRTTQNVSVTGQLAGDAPAPPAAQLGQMAGDPAPMPTAVGGQAAEPVWLHNGSAMRVEVEDRTVRFYFDTARPGADDAQVAGRKRPLFEGRNVSETSYAGSAFAYSPKCGEVPYEVKGSASPDGSRLELRGQRPEFDDKCGISQQTAETLVFELR